MKIKHAVLTVYVLAAGALIAKKIRDRVKSNQIFKKLRDSVESDKKRKRNERRRALAAQKRAIAKDLVKAGYSKV